MGKELYRHDFVLWSTEQGRALRRAEAAQINTPDPIDWEHVAEEIETLGRSERAALRSRIAVIIEHLMKLQASPAMPPRDDWIYSIEIQRRDIAYALEDSRSLRREIGSMIERETPRVRATVSRSLARHGEQPTTDVDQLSYAEDQVLGDWFPGPASQG